MAFIQIIPAKQFGPRERVTNEKLNELGSPHAVFKVGGHKFGGVISRLISVPVSDLGAITTSASITYPIAFVGARTDAMWIVNILNLSEMDDELEWTPYCTVNDTLTLRLRVINNTDVSGDDPVEMRVTMFSPVNIEYGRTWTEESEAAIALTPGYVFETAPRERVTRAKLNQLGTPTAVAQANLTDVRYADVEVPIDTHGGTGDWVTGDEAEYDLAFPGAVAAGTAWELEQTATTNRFFQSWIFCDTADVVTIKLRARAGASYAEPATMGVTMFRFEV